MSAIPIEHARELRGYDSPGAAIRAADRHARQAEARRLGTLLDGRRLVDAWCGLRTWVLEFTGPVRLRIRALDDAPDKTDPSDLVAWEVVDERPDAAPADGPIELDWGDGPASVVDVAALARPRIDAEFRQLYVNQAGFYVYLRGHRYLWFSAVRRTDTGEIILYAGEEE